MFAARHRAAFLPPHDCMGQGWTEAIAVLNVASAELRLEAAVVARGQSPGHPYGDHRERFDELQGRASKLDELAHWLRSTMSLPAIEPREAA